VHKSKEHVIVVTFDIPLNGICTTQINVRPDSNDYESSKVLLKMPLVAHQHQEHQVKPLAGEVTP